MLWAKVSTVHEQHSYQDTETSANWAASDTGLYNSSLQCPIVNIAVCNRLRTTWCRKLQLRLGSVRSIWDHEFNAEIAEACGLTPEESAIWVGPARLAEASGNVSIRNVTYRTLLFDEDRVTQDSGVAMTFATNTGSKVWSGRITSIIEVNFGGCVTIMLFVSI